MALPIWSSHSKMERHFQRFISISVEAKNFWIYLVNIYDWKSKENTSEKLSFDYLNLRSPRDNRLYIVREEIPHESQPQPVSAYDQLNLFDNSNDLLKRIVRRKFYARFRKLNLVLLFRKGPILVEQQSRNFLVSLISLKMLYLAKMILLPVVKIQKRLSNQTSRH